MRLMLFVHTVVFFLIGNLLHAQETELSSVDQRKRDAMVEKLNLSEVQLNQVDSVFHVFAPKILSYDLELKTVQRDTTLTDKELSTRMIVIRQNKKDERELRELELKTLLLPEQVLVYEKDIAPTKPKVLHFGIHNRADCKVCVK